MNHMSCPLCQRPCMESLTVNSNVLRCSCCCGTNDRENFIAAVAKVDRSPISIIIHGQYLSIMHASLTQKWSIYHRNSKSRSFLAEGSQPLTPVEALDILHRYEKIKAFL